MDNQQVIQDQQKKIDELIKKVEDLATVEAVSSSTPPKIIIKEMPQNKTIEKPVIVTPQPEQNNSVQINSSTSEPIKTPVIPDIVEPKIGENLVQLSFIPQTFISLQDKKIEYDKQVANLSTIFDLNTYEGMSAWGKEINKLNAEHSAYTFRYDACKRNQGQYALADVSTGLCYCQTGYIKDDLSYQCVAYERFCRNKYFENGFFKQGWCLYCPTGYKLSAEFMCYK